MRPNIRWAVAATLLAALPLLSGCEQVSEAKHSISEPYKKEKIAEPDLYRVKLIESAADRLDVRMSPVTEARAASGSLRKVIPYGAVIYDIKGNTWTYVGSDKLTYLREAITVDYIDGDRVFLTKGPKVGTPVVTYGAAELYGIEFGLGK